MRLVSLFILLLPFTCFSQLSNRHWLPPLHSRLGSTVEDHYVYLSTPIAIPFQVTVTTGDGVPISGSPFTISEGNPVRILIGNTQPSPMFLDINDVNIVTGNKGLILEASKDFYASFRVRSTNHAEILVSKGKTALGTSFRLGSVPQQYDSTIRNFVSSFMATEDNTEVTLSDYDNQIVFVSGFGNVDSDSQTFLLNKGQSVVVSGYTNIVANRTGFIGALVTSTKPIVVNTGNATGGTGSNPGNGSSGQDFNLDQIVPVEKVGSEYIVVRGNGSDNSEFPLVIATVDNTEIYVNGDTTPITIINAGEYFLVPNSLYQGLNSQNVYVESNHPIYMYQILAGSGNDATSGLNFIPPLSCYWQKSVNMIPEYNFIGNTPYNDSEIIIVTQTGSTITINGNPTSSSPSSVLGNSIWETYRISGLSGNIIVESNGALAVGVFGSDGNAAGFGGYYSGFGSDPEDTETVVCTNNIIDLFERINGNPQPGGIWTVPVDAPELNGNLFNPAINVAGIYTYSFSITCNGEVLNTDVDVNVSIEIGPNAGTDASIPVCTTDAPFNLTNLLGTNITEGGIWKFNNVVRPDGIFNPSIDLPGNYSYTIPATDVCDEVTATITISTSPSPNIITITPYKKCDDLSVDGDDTNGFTSFDLPTKNNEILNGQNGILVTYHETLAEAEANTNPKTNYYSNSKTIFVRLSNTSTNCFSITTLDLIVTPLPLINNEVILKQCDTDNDAVTVFNLTEANRIIEQNSTNSFLFSYHTSFNNATNNTGIITNETQYTASNGTVIWARVENEFGCFKISKVNLIVSTTSLLASDRLTIYECDDLIDSDNPFNDGFDFFNLSEATTHFLNLFPSNQNLVVTYYENQIDALAEQNQISQTTPYRNRIATTQNIWVRIDSSLNNDCIGLGDFLTLVVNPLPNVNLGNDFSFCVDPITGLGSQTINATPLTPGSYSYQWNPENPNGNSPIYPVTQSGNYSIIVKNLNTNCEHQDSITITTSSAPATFNAEIITPVFASGEATIIALPDGGYGQYEYSLNLIDWQSSNIFSNLSNGSYTVYVRDIQGCGIKNSNTLFVVTYPSFFTPNGDGYNDTWNIANLDLSYKANIFIFDRYGKLITQISPYGEGWDGTLNGKLLPSTDYWFRIEYKENGTAKEFKSHFSLIR